jgi:hypothetical protein
MDRLSGGAVVVGVALGVLVVPAPAGADPIGGVTVIPGSSWLGMVRRCWVLWGGLWCWSGWRWSVCGCVSALGGGGPG